MAVGKTQVGKAPLYPLIVTGTILKREAKNYFTLFVLLNKEPHNVLPASGK